MKTSKMISLLSIVAVAFMVVNCSDSATSTNDTSFFQQNNMKEPISAIPADSLSDTERASLLFMIEEEKVARDSYVLFFFEIWR